MTTIQIKYRDIPAYLRAGDLFRNLDSNDPECIIHVPTDCLVADVDRAGSLDEFCQLIKVVKYWILDELPYGIHRFSALNGVNAWKTTIVAEFGAECATELEKSLGNVIIKYRDIPSYLHAGGFFQGLDSTDPCSAIQIPADCLHPEDETIASLQDFAQLLRATQFWMLYEIPQSVLRFCSENAPQRWIKSIPACLNLNIVRALPGLLESSVPKPMCLKNIFETIINMGRWEVLRHEVQRLNKDSIGTYATTVAAELGNLQLLTYLHQEGFSWDQSTCSAASEHGHIKCLQYAHVNGCSWDNGVYESAATYGRLDCMQYAFDCGLELGPSVCIVAASSGQLSCLQFAHENGCPFKFAASAATLEGHFACLRYALENGCEIYHKDLAACKNACKNDDLASLQLLHQYGAPWTDWTSFSAAQSGSLLCLQYLHENGCPWEKDTVTCAVDNGHVSVLRYALEHGCPYPELLARRGVKPAGSLQTLQYLVEEQLMLMNEEVFVFALLRGDLPCVQYLIDQGCPYQNQQLTEDKANHITFLGVIKEDQDIIQCVEYAMERGWVPNQCFVDLVNRMNNPCGEWLAKEGFHKTSFPKFFFAQYSMGK